MNHHKLIKLTSHWNFYHIPNPNFLSYPVFRCWKIVRVIFKQQNTHQPNQPAITTKKKTTRYFIFCCSWMVFTLFLFYQPNNCVWVVYPAPYPQMILQFCRSSRKHNYCRSLPLIRLLILSILTLYVSSAAVTHIHTLDTVAGKHMCRMHYEWRKA